MDPAKRVTRNTVFLTSGRLFSRVMQFFLFVYAARILGPHNFGIFSLGYAMVQIFSISMDLGISSYMVQQLSRDIGKAPLLTGLALRAKCLLIPSGFLLMMVVGIIAADDTTSLWVLAILGVGIVLDNITDIFTAVFEADQRMEYPALIIAVCNSIMSGVGIALIALGGNLLVLCGVFALGAFLRMASSTTWSIHNYGSPSFSSPPTSIFSFLKSSIPFAVVVLFVNVYYYIDTVFLSVYCSKEIVGLYNSAFRILEAPLFITSSLAASIFPAISRLFVREREKIRGFTEKIFVIALAFGLSIAAVTALVSEDLMVLLFGKEYLPAGNLLFILIFSVAFIMPGSICGTSIRAMNMQRISAYVAGAGALLNIALNQILIPRFAAQGAAWTTLFTEGFVFIIYFMILRRYMGLTVKADSLARIFLLVVSLIAIVQLGRGLGVISQLALCVVFFFPLLHVTGLVKFGDVVRLVR